MKITSPVLTTRDFPVRILFGGGLTADVEVEDAPFRDARRLELPHDPRRT